MTKPGTSVRRYLGVAMIAVAALGVVFAMVWRDRASGIDVASARPAWTMVVSNASGGGPVEFEVLLRVGDRVRLLRGRTPAELRVGNRRVIAQFRSLVPFHRLAIRSTMQRTGVSLSTTWDPDQGLESATFVSTYGRLGLPQIGAFGWMNPKWGARERYPSAWALWPDFWRPPTREEEAAVPPPEDWPASAPAP